MRTALLVGLAAAGCAGPAAPSADPAARYAEAAALAESDPPRALAILDDLLVRAPAYAAAHVARGSVLKALGRGAEAAEAYARALALQPGASAVRAARGLVLESLKRDAEAEAEYAAMIVESPGRPDGFLFRARLFRRLGRYSEALRDQGEASARDRDGWGRYYNAGVESSRGRRWEDARIHFELALLLAPDLGEAWLGLARVHAEEGRLEEALQAADRAVERRAGEADVWYARGEIRRALGRHAEASSDYARAISLDPRAHHFVGRGLCHAAAGRPADALIDFDEAVHRDATCRDALVERARLLAKLDRTDRARDDYAAALAILATPDVIRELGLLHAAKEEWREAVYYLEQARGLSRPGPLREKIDMELRHVRERSR